MGWNDRLDPPDYDCCEADDCTKPDEFGNIECKCDDHWCTGCGLKCNCRCDADYDAWKDSQIDWDN